MIFAAIAALTLASCAKIENSAPTKETAVPIGFTNYAPKQLTKANDTYAPSTELIASKQFAVYSYATTNGTEFATSSLSALGTKFMDRVAVTFTDNNDNGANNDYSPRRYWPSGDTPDWLTFWAYYPVESSAGIATNPTNGINYTAPTGSNGLGSFVFTAASTPATMVDFMVADVVNDKIYGTTSGEHIAVNGEVPFTFRHQLAKIRCQFKTDLDPATDATTKVVLTSAELQKVNTVGTLSATYNVSASPATQTSWGSQGTPSTYAVTIGGSAIDNNVLTTTLVGGENADLFLMIPQETLVNTDANAQKLVITWDVKTFDSSTNANAATAATATTVGNDGLLSITHNSAVLFLDDVTVKDGDTTKSNDWAKNQFTTYAITIGPKPILFTATVQPWDSETTGTINVQ